MGNFESARKLRERLKGVKIDETPKEIIKETPKKTTRKVKNGK